MKLFYTLIFFSLSFALSAQLSHEPNPLAMTVHQDSLDVKLEINFNNSEDTVYNVYWKLIKDTLTWKDEWVTYLCDLNLCYGFNIDQGLAAKNIMGKGKSKFEFHFKPNNTPGCTIIGLKLYNDRNLTDEVYSTSININNCISSVKNVISNVKSNAKLYPNPASSYFQIDNDVNVDKIKIYNLLGREVKTFFHYNNAQHEISELKSGIYLVKLLDSKNRVLKTIKMNKIYTGA